MIDDDPNPRTEDARLRALLAAPQPPADLRARIRANLATPRPVNRVRRALRAGALLGVVLLAGALLLAPFGERAPDVVTAAYDDMRKDRGLRGTYDADPNRWFATNAVHMPAGVSVDLNKDCTLDGIIARHLRLVNPALGRVNVFVYEQALRAKRASAYGAVADHRWLILEPRPGVVVIVLYDAANQHDSVVHLISQMFATPIRI